MTSVPFFPNFTLQINICHQTAFLTMNLAFLCYKDSYFLLFRKETEFIQLYECIFIFIFPILILVYCLSRLEKKNTKKQLCNHVVILSLKLEGKRKQYKQHTRLG